MMINSASGWQWLVRVNTIDEVQAWYNTGKKTKETLQERKLDPIIFDMIINYDGLDKCWDPEKVQTNLDVWVSHIS